MYTNKSIEGPSSRRDYKSTQKLKSKKEQKLLKLMQPNSDSEEESEHELSYYINDRVKLMKEVLKIIKPRKIKTMAPECMKRMDIQEINSILLEELLGISNKRLRYIFEAKVLEEESSTDEDQPVDVISLDSISDDDFVVISDDEEGKPRNKHKRKKIKEEPRSKSRKVKREKPDKDNETVKEKDKKRRKEIDQVREKLKNKDDMMEKEKETMGEENLMSVLELLELQARARAIRSQLELECKRKKEEQKRLEEEKRKQESQNGKVDEEDEIIIEVMQDVEIVITSSDSENESKEKKVKPKDKPPSPQKNKSRKKTSESSTSNNQPTSSETPSAIELNEESSQDSHEIDLITQKLNEPGVSLIHTSDKEDGEVSDEEPMKGNKLDIIVEEIKKDGENIDTVVKSEDDSDSSNDNLLVVKKREERKRLQERDSEHDEHQPSKTTETTSKNEKPEEKSSSDTHENNPEPNETQKPEEKTSSDVTKNNAEPNESEPTNKLLDKVVEEFIKSQPPPPDNSEELHRLEEEKKQLEKNNEKDKKKRLKNLKSKLESFKQDVAVESTSANVTVLENIVIKPKEVGANRKSLEHSDDLVINLDQDDYDCITLD